MAAHINPVRQNVVRLDTGFITYRQNSNDPGDFPSPAYLDAWAAIFEPFTLSAEAASRYFDEWGAWNGVELLEQALPPKPGPELTHIVTGLGSLEFRFAAAARADELFRARLAAPREHDSLDWDIVEGLDEPVFAFFTAILATMESLGYALGWLPYAWGKRSRAPNPRSMSLGETAAEFRRMFRHEPVTDELTKIAASPILSKIRALRNVLEHRGALPIEMDDPTQTWVLFCQPHLSENVVLSKELTSEPRAWAADSLRSVLSAVPSLAERHQRP